MYSELKTKGAAIMKKIVVSAILALVALGLLLTMFPPQ